MDDNHDHNHEEGTPKEYIKFGGVIVFILLVTWLITGSSGFSPADFMRYFMAVFFVTFGLFKLADLEGFVSSYRGYDIIAKRLPAYGYLYPFIELTLGAGFLLNVPSVNLITLIIMVIGSIGVIQQLLRKSKIKCACLGTYIKLPLTTVSLVEDLAMGLMALLLLLGK